MKCKDVLKTLKISRQTLCRYKKQGKIRVKKLHNGYFDYNEKDVYILLNQGVERKNYIYGRVSTNKQKKDLEHQIELLKQFCFTSGIKISGIFQDVASGISFEKRKNFFIMLDEIIDGNVHKIIISYKDRLSRVGFDLFKFLFKKYGVEIVVMSEMGDKTQDSKEVFNEIISLLHCFAMKLYSNRRKKVIESICKE